jgi:hypothetical protein
MQATSYISLLHAVLGAVLFGWFFTVFLIARGPFAQGVKGSWMQIALPLNAWFIPDTTYSLLSGFWQNASLNLVFYTVFMIPLLATFKHFTDNLKEV